MDLAALVQDDKYRSPIESDASPSLLWVDFDNGTAIQKAEMRRRSCFSRVLTFDEMLAWLKQLSSKPERGPANAPNDLTIPPLAGPRCRTNISQYLWPGHHMGEQQPVTSIAVQAERAEPLLRPSDRAGHQEQTGVHRAESVGRSGSRYTASLRDSWRQTTSRTHRARCYPDEEPSSSDSEDNHG